MRLLTQVPTIVLPISLKAAEGDFGPGVYDVAGVVLESNASLPPEIDFMSPQGIQSIRDYVNTATAPPLQWPAFSCS
jgi:hypothetical protein